MPKKRADAVLNFSNQPMVVASVGTMKSTIILSLGDGREERFTYLPMGDFTSPPETALAVMKQVPARVRIGEARSPIRRTYV